ncbi:MAG: UDP-N-acetylmuramate dehydrogenase [Gammaproteobacteria bacterium]|nr:UDP-N-acetylmuramate dehydrogenase [Gammaproteobacteria bacterium]
MSGTLEKNVSLAEYVSWKAGGVAKQLYQPDSVHDLQDFLASLPPEEPLLWLGLGSNTLIRDGGFDGTVIFTQKGLRDLRQVDDLTIYAEAGVACPTLARFSAKHNMAGGEWFAGIPGTVGGALQMNAGAFGGETWERVVSVEMINRQGELSTHKPTDFSVSYRHVEGPADHWFIGVTFAFTPGNKQTSLTAISELLDRRAATQPTGVPTCGSVFRNPPGNYAARLIESIGLKGHMIGKAQVSEKHANFIVNTGGATAAEIEALVDYVAQQVEQECGILLVREVQIIGDHI